MRAGYLLLTIFFFTLHVHAQVSPPDNAKLSYRLIGFSVPEKKGVTGYEFEVEEVIVTDSGKEEYKPVLQKMSDNNRLIATVPQFGKTYRWNVHYYKGKNIKETSPEYTFSAGYSVYTDTSKYHLRVIKNEFENNEMLVFLDGTRTLYKMNGEPLWSIPLTPGIIDDNTRIRDLHMTPKHTITFLTEKNAYEIDYNGNVLWEAPDDGRVSGDSTEQYHHQFTRLANGNYMIAGTEVSMREIPSEYGAVQGNEQSKIETRDGKKYTKVECGTLIEYSPDKKVVWSWKSSDLFTAKELFSRTSPSGVINTHTHMNSFFFDSTTNTIYIGFRDINGIIKIAYPSGKVLARYGEDYTDSKNVTGPDLFRAHHNTSITKNGNILLFNNNTIRKTAMRDKGKPVSSLQIIEEPNKRHNDLSLLWEFKCDFDTTERSYSATGGTAYELSDGEILATMGAISRNFIVNSNKALTWYSKLEAFSNQQQKWLNCGNYKISPIETKVELQDLIFNINNGQLPNNKKDQ